MLILWHMFKYCIMKVVIITYFYDLLNVSIIMFMSFESLVNMINANN